MAFIDIWPNIMSIVPWHACVISKICEISPFLALVCRTYLSQFSHFLLFHSLKLQKLGIFSSWNVRSIHCNNEILHTYKMTITSFHLVHLHCKREAALVYGPGYNFWVKICQCKQTLKEKWMNEFRRYYKTKCIDVSECVIYCRKAEHMNRYLQETIYSLLLKFSNKRLKLYGARQRWWW